MTSPSSEQTPETGSIHADLSELTVSLNAAASTFDEDDIVAAVENALKAADCEREQPQVGACKTKKNIYDNFLGNFDIFFENIF